MKLFNKAAHLPRVIRTGALIAISASLLNGQAINGRLSGSVVDASDAGIPGARITITNEATQISLKTASDGQGGYIATALPPGNYTVRVEAPGFRPAVSSANVVRPRAST